MNFEIIKKPSFSVIGKEGQGPLENSFNWIQPLWQAANRDFSEIEKLTKQPLITWGAMQNSKRDGSPWDDSGGLYLAGAEVENSAQAPAGWTKWTFPDQTYMVVATQLSDMQNVFVEIHSLADQQNLKITGATQERYPNPSQADSVELWFPVQILSALTENFISSDGTKLY